MKEIRRLILEQPENYRRRGIGSARVTRTAGGNTATLSIPLDQRYGFYLPPEKAWRAIEDYCRTGERRSRIRWMDPDRIRERQEAATPHDTEELVPEPVESLRETAETA